MGGYGSGRWRERREVIENCQFVNVDDLPFHLKPGYDVGLPLKNYSGENVMMMKAEYIPSNDSTYGLAILAKSGGEQKYHQFIPISNTSTKSGSRICFICPSQNCGQPTRKIYVPPNSKYLACRKCHKLSYSSSQRRTEREARFEKITEKIELEAEDFDEERKRGGEN